MITMMTKQTPTAADRFFAAAKAVRESHGGHPTATVENGKIVFTYPDGTRTCEGKRLEAK